VKYIVITILLFTLRSLSITADAPPSSEGLNFEISYFNAITKSAVNLEKYFEKYPEEEHEVIMKSDRFINGILKAELFRLADIYALQSNITPSMKEVLHNKVKNFMLRATRVTLKGTISQTKLMTRKYGYGKIIAILLSIVMDFAVPIAFPPITPISVYTPYFMLIEEFFFKPAERAQLRFKTNKALGLNSSEFWRMKKEISNKLKSYSHDDLLFPIVTDQLFTIQKSGFLNTIFNKLGINRNKANYYSINNFVKRNNIKDKHITWINKNKSLTKEVKALLIIYHIYEQGDAKVNAQFQTDFSEFFTKRSHLPKLNQLKRWTRILLSAQNTEDINKAMTLIPPGIPPLIIAEVWQSLALDELIKRIPMRAGGLLKLKQELEVLKAVATTKQHQESWNKAFAKLFQQKLAAVIPEYKKDCLKSNKGLFNLLLKNNL
jgi:hypothetical protein